MAAGRRHASSSPRRSVSLRRGDRPDPRSNEEAFAYLTVAVKDPDPQKVGRAFANTVVEMALASYPGFT